MTALDRVVIDGERLDADVRDRLISARESLTMEGASEVRLEVDDQDVKLLRSGLLSRPRRFRDTPEALEDAAWDRFGKSRMVLDGEFYRLAGAGGDVGGQLNLTFESEVATLLRRIKGPWKALREDMTRAEAVHMGTRRVRNPIIPVYSPDAEVKQKIRKSPERREFEREEQTFQRGRVPESARSDKGFSPDAAAKLKVKGQPANREQVRNMEIVLRVADELRAGPRATLAMICANIGEASYYTRARNPTSGAYGLFQLLPSTARSFNLDPLNVRACARQFMVHGYTRGVRGNNGAIPMAQRNPRMSPGTIASLVEGSDANGAFYDRYRDEADKILEAWGGVNRGPVERDRLVTRPYPFRVDRGEGFWDAFGRWADEVRWRRFARGNVLFFVSDQTLFRARPRAVVTPEEPALIEGPRFEADVGIPVSEVTMRVQVGRWTANPGHAILLDRMGPIDGKWLGASQDRDLEDPFEIADVTLHRPRPQLAEPAADTVRKTVRFGPGVSGRGVIRDRGGARGIVEEAVRIAIAAGGGEVYVGSAYRAGDTVGSGGPSDHSQNNEFMAARDIGVRGIDLLVGPPSPKLDQACAAIVAALGGTYRPFTVIIKDFQYRGFRVQVIWRTPAFGGHLGHIHIGARRR